MTPTRDLTIPGGFNVRDLGGYPGLNGPTRWRRLLRSGGVHRMGAEGVEALHALGVATVIDLRRPDEETEHPSPLRAVPGIAFHAVSLFEGLSPASMQADDVLLDLYLQALNTRAEAFVAVLDLIAKAPPGAVLFHCTAGKDRTGLIAALLLDLAGVNPDTIITDYALTGPRIAPVLAQFTADAEARGIAPESFRPLLACAPETMAATLAHLQSLGGARAWLETAGLSQPALAALTARLSEDL